MKLAQARKQNAASSSSNPGGLPAARGIAPATDGRQLASNAGGANSGAQPSTVKETAARFDPTDEMAYVRAGKPVPGVQSDWLDPIGIGFSALTKGADLLDFVPFDKIPDLVQDAYQGAVNGLSNFFQPILGPLADPATFTDPFVDGVSSPFPAGGSDPDDSGG